MFTSCLSLRPRASLFVFALAVFAAHGKRVDSEKMRAIEELKMDERQYKKAENLHLNLYAAAFGGLLGSVGRETFKTLSGRRAQELQACIERVADHDLQAGAKCIVNAWDSRFTQRISNQRTHEPANGKRKEPDDEKFHPKQMAAPPPLSSKATNISLTSVGARLFLNGFRQLRNATEKKESAFLHRLIEINADARQYKRTLADVVLDRKGKKRRRKTASERIRALMPDELLMKQQRPLMKEAFELMDVVEKHNDGKLNAAFLSPNQALSPNLFPLYKDEKGILPVPDLLEGAGLNEAERTAFLDLIIETSGASQMIGEVMRIFERPNGRALNDEINNVTILMQERIREVRESLSDEQKKQMKEREFAFLTRPQLEKVYGPEGLMGSTPFDLDAYERWTPTQLRKGLMRAVRSVAEGAPLAEAHFGPRRRRVKRQFEPGEPGTVLVVGEPEILSPLVFAPDILEAAVLGPVILSPELASYRRQPILSPNIGCPLILSPYVLSPKLIGGTVFEAYILNHILSPTVASGIVLNPYVGSPAFLTESAFVFDILRQVRNVAVSEDM
ncbi:hypothetical protein M3Y99_00563000 [Aphelenchoides fujianensis]|nr:hypothetical protein M3Y99_00563000 [Aphelenchoides fujianensis]